MPHLFCFGLGYCAKALAKRLTPKGWQVTGTVRAAEHVDATSLIFSGEAPGNSVAQALGKATHILASIPPGEAGDPALAYHADDIREAAPHLHWIGVFSTVGVYGDHDGGWVDEDTPPHPVSRRGRLRLLAETAWRTLGEEIDVPVVIFRLPGIYGPGRNPLEKVKAGKAHCLIKKGQVFNRIHVDDVATVVEASMTAPGSRIYNVCDDEPAPPQDVTAFAAELLGLPAPPDLPIEKAKPSPMALSFYGENKRVSNRRIREELGVALAYPTYREGLRALANRLSG